MKLLGKPCHLFGIFLNFVRIVCTQAGKGLLALDFLALDGRAAVHTYQLIHLRRGNAQLKNGLGEIEFTHQGIGLRQLQITFFDEHTGLCVIDIGGTVAAFPYLGPLGNVNFFHLSSFL